MSIFQSLIVGVTGLQAQNNALNTIADNLANAQTVGYKSSTPTFASLVTNDTPAFYSPGGVQQGFTQNIQLQGELAPASSPTDIAVSGSGFFVVTGTPSSGGTNLSYTRAGAFEQDSNGNLVNGAGYYLQGWPIDSSGALPSSLTSSTLQTVNLLNINETPTSTSLATVQVNLTASQAAYSGTPAYDPTNSSADMTSGAVQPDFDTFVNVIDSSGAAHNVEVGFLKTGTNTWAVEMYDNTASDLAGTNPNPQLAAGTITFNGDGTPASISSSLTNPISISWANGATNNDLSVNWGTAGAPFGTAGATVIGRSDGVTQYDSAYTTDVTQNGIVGGALTSVSIAQNGDVVGKFTDGSSKNIYQIPLATFIEPDQLQSVTGNVFTQTELSGTPNFVQPDQNGIGTINSEDLESSNVDTAAQLTDLIVAQQAYQDNTKTITTTDQMLQMMTSISAPL